MPYGGGDELAKGCNWPLGLAGAGCSRMLAIMLERHLTGNSKRAGGPPGTEAPAL